MSYRNKRIIWLVLCLIAIYSELDVAQTGEFLWLTLSDAWRIAITIIHIIFIFIGALFVIYYNSKDINS
jgi:hypothetical protein